MTQPFTASEVRDAITWKYGDKSTRISAMLTAFADMLEAQEKAMPVAVVKDSDALYTGWLSWTGEPAPPETKLYTHPAHSAQAQPPAASVTDVSDAEVSAAIRAFNKYTDTHFGPVNSEYMSGAMREALLAARESPNG